MDKIEINKLDESELFLGGNQRGKVMDSIQRQQEKMFRAVKNARTAKEEEELRRHKEIITALKETGEKGATIVIGDNANAIQIQQNSAGALQQMENKQKLDYQKAYEILDEIKSYFDFPQFENTFGNNTENIKQLVLDTMDAIKKGEDEGIIKKSLHLIRELVVGTTGSMIASGILALLGQLSI